jgi:hypothetical protein
VSGSVSTFIISSSSLPQGFSGDEVEGWSWFDGGSYAKIVRPDPWQCGALAGIQLVTF